MTDWDPHDTDEKERVLAALRARAALTNDALRATRAGIQEAEARQRETKRSAARPFLIGLVVGVPVWTAVSAALLVWSGL